MSNKYLVCSIVEANIKIGYYRAFVGPYISPYTIKFLDLRAKGKTVNVFEFERRG